MARKANSFVGGYVSDLWRLHSGPTDFFKRLPLSGGITVPLTFALVTHWIGRACEFLWSSAVFGSGLFSDLYQQIRDQYGGDEIATLGEYAWLQDAGTSMKPLLVGVGSVILDPFYTAVGLLISAFLVWISAKLLVPGAGPRAMKPTGITYESAMRIACYALAPSIFLGLPLLGGLIAKIYGFVLLVIGAREIYRVSSGRAVFIAIFPKLVALGAIMAVVAAVVALGLMVFLVPILGN